MLDIYMGDEVARDISGHSSGLHARRRERDDQLEMSLKIAVEAFAAQWLPLVPQHREDHIHQDEQSIRSSWRAARREMLKVINRASYRSILALYLFSQTPVPIGVSDEEELDGVNGLVCIQTALLQIQRLRERQNGGQFHGSGTLAWTDSLLRSSPSDDPKTTFLNLESRAYWAAVIWDTSISLTSNLRACLTSGLKGACSEPVWRLTRSFLTGSFHPKTESWRTEGFEVSDDTASRIISAAAVCKLYVWKNITSLKEALREGVDEESVLFTWRALLDAIEIFHTSVRPLLTSCERRLNFLNQGCRLVWYQVLLQYYLGILVMADAIEANNRTSMLDEVRETVQDAENEAFNVIKAGTEDVYTIHLSDKTANDESITTSLVAMDPNPHFVIDLAILLNHIIIAKYRYGKIKLEIYSHLFSILSKALDQLPRYSKSVHAARETLAISFEATK